MTRTKTIEKGNPNSTKDWEQRPCEIIVLCFSRSTRRVAKKVTLGVDEREKKNNDTVNKSVLIVQMDTM